MKKLLSSFAITLISLNAFSQDIPNGDFEDWTNSTGNIIAIWEAPTISSWDIGLPTAFKVTDAQHGSFAIKLESNANSTDTAFGYILIGEFGDGGPEEARNGFPISGKITALNGYYKTAVQAGDTAAMIVIVLSDTVQVGMGLYTFPGATSTYTSFSVPITYSDTTKTPDNVVVAAVSSNILGDGDPIPGSTLWLDNFTLSGTSDTVPNYSFENWTSPSWDNADGWDSFNDESAPYSSTFTVTKSADAHTGNYALKVMMEDFDGDTVGYAYLGDLSYDEQHGHSGSGMAYTKKTDTICGYYKFAAASPGDKGAVYLEFFVNDSSFQSIYIQLDTASSWSYFEKEINLSTDPTLMKITINASEQRLPGSTIIIDNLKLKSDTTMVGVQEIFSQPKVIVYPNPASDQVTVITTYDDARYVEMIDLAGRLTKIYPTRSNVLKINTRDYPAGYYTYRILDRNKNQLHQGKIGILR